MFVNDYAFAEEEGRVLRATVDRERGLELRQIKITYDEAFFVLKVEGGCVSIYTTYRFTGENNSIIEYTIRSITSGWPRLQPYRFSSHEDKRRIAKYVEEALKVYGLHYTLSPGRSVEVKFADQSLSSGSA
jgi:hypothetical protein